MILPAIRGVIRRRLLVNFNADAEVVQQLLPSGLQPKLQGGRAIVGICLIRLEQMRPGMLPGRVGFSSENAAHRIAVCWSGPREEPREGVFIPRRHTDSSLIVALGGRAFPGVHKRAHFDINDAGSSVDIDIEAAEGDMNVRLRARDSGELPAASKFASVAEASEFFRGGAVGYSPSRDPRGLEGLRLLTPVWNVSPLAVDEVRSSWIEDESNFPAGSVSFDCALVMRDIDHVWIGEPSLDMEVMEHAAKASHQRPLQTTKSPPR